MKNTLRDLREDRGWTQGALADQLDVSRQTVNALETGRYDPSLPLAFRIARLFSQPIEQIFNADDDPGPTPGSTTIAGSGAASNPARRPLRRPGR